MHPKEPTNDNQRIAAEPTPGPYEIRVKEGSDFDPEIYSGATGESVAHVYSRGFRREDAPQADEVTLKNAALLRAAPQLRDRLEEVLREEPRLRPSRADGIRQLLAQIDAGPGEAFLQERERERQEFERLISAQVMEMSEQSGQKPFRLVDEPEAEEEEAGHSF